RSCSRSAAGSSTCAAAWWTNPRRPRPSGPGCWSGPTTRWATWSRTSVRAWPSSASCWNAGEPRRPSEEVERVSVETHVPTRDEAWALVIELTRSETLRRHMRSVEAAMRAYARRFGEDEERWAVLGLIHDWDYETGPTPEQHPVRGMEMLRERGWPEDVIQDI